MDPIEKLLSDLAPARAPRDLDQTMAQLFQKADRRRQIVRAIRSCAAMGFVLAVGLGLGYQWGEASIPEMLPAEITYVVPAALPESRGAFLDYSNSSEQLLEGDVRLSVEILPVSAPVPSETENGA